ncbi:unnamed protein product [Didymodactylos carnosus]|uniref:F-BAR domain-containing protein n=1 Tax=Didymodactylos carnosus TaxID=1234261 RepID=A0A815C5X5_9BILA|nr:unnamed protein product [Didymodactylos carnosus]CAF1279620.1 unnamed protein product [Didymodactylos carnosus]CAF3786470.1 unnamed protein product [Didymodactylos carnosus]CAF4073935.1 unnamed protein product [Didymodactylos carnosus]
MAQPEHLLSNPWFGKGFFEPGQYKVAIERFKGGYDSCKLFLKCVEQRVKIEHDYAADLKKWSHTWQKEIQRCQEYGTTKQTWLASIVAGEQYFYTHSEIAKNLHENCIEKMLQYEKENYDKSHIKHVKEFEREFEEAQKSWLKLLQKIDAAKKMYRESKYKLKTYEAVGEILQSESSVSDEQKRRAKDLVDIRKKESTSQESKYKQLIGEMQNQRPNYEKEMTDLLNQTHDLEYKRKSFFKMMFQEYHDALFSTRLDETLTKASSDFKELLNHHDATLDVKWWNKTYGSDTNTQWPTFDEELDETNT